MKEKKCTVPCPKLKVHNDPMTECKSTKYLGNFVSTSGGIQETVEDRRKKGWGKIATIMGILGEVDMGCNRLEAGLLLRQSILVNSLLCRILVWTNGQAAVQTRDSGHFSADQADRRTLQMCPGV